MQIGTRPRNLWLGIIKPNFGEPPVEIINRDEFSVDSDLWYSNQPNGSPNDPQNCLASVEPTSNWEIQDKDCNNPNPNQEYAALCEIPGFQNFP